MLDQLPAPMIPIIESDQKKEKHDALPKRISQILDQLFPANISHHNNKQQSETMNPLELDRIKQSIQNYLQSFSIKNDKNNINTMSSSRIDTFSSVSLSNYKHSHPQPFIFMEQRDSGPNNMITTWKEFLSILSNTYDLPSQISLPSDVPIDDSTSGSSDNGQSYHHIANQIERDTETISPIVYAGHYTWGEITNNHYHDSSSSHSTNSFACMTNLAPPIQRLERCLYRKLWSMDPSTDSSNNDVTKNHFNPKQRLRRQSSSSSGSISVTRLRHDKQRQLSNSSPSPPPSPPTRSYRCLSDLNDKEFFQLLLQRGNISPSYKSTGGLNKRNNRLKTTSSPSSSSTTSCLSETMRMFSGINDEDLLESLALQSIVNNSDDIDNLPILTSHTDIHQHTMPSYNWLLNHTLHHIRQCSLPLLHSSDSDDDEDIVIGQLSHYYQLQRYPTTIITLLRSNYPLLYSKLLMIDTNTSDSNSERGMTMMTSPSHYCPPLRKSSKQYQWIEKASYWDSLIYSIMYQVASSSSLYDNTSLLLPYHRHCLLSKYHHYQLLHDPSIPIGVNASSTRDTMLIVIQSPSIGNNNFLTQLLQYATGLPILSSLSSTSLGIEYSQYSPTYREYLSHLCDDSSSDGIVSFNDWLRGHSVIYLSPSIHISLKVTKLRRNNDNDNTIIWKSITTSTSTQSTTTQSTTTSSTIDSSIRQCLINKLSHTLSQPLTTTTTSTLSQQSINRDTWKVNTAIITKDPFYLIWLDIITHTHTGSSTSSMLVSYMNITTILSQYKPSHTSTRNLLTTTNRLTNTSIYRNINKGGTTTSNTNTIGRYRHYHKHVNVNPNKRSNIRNIDNNSVLQGKDEKNTMTTMMSKEEETDYLSRYAWLVDRATYLTLSPSSKPYDSTSSNVFDNSQSIDSLQYYSYESLLESAWNTMIHSLHDSSLRRNEGPLAKEGPLTKEGPMTKEGPISKKLSQSRNSFQHLLQQSSSMSSLSHHRISCSFGLSNKVLIKQDERMIEDEIPRMREFYREYSRIFALVRQLIKQRLHDIGIHHSEIHLLLPL